jgi:CHAD domain-containing protein
MHTNNFDISIQLKEAIEKQINNALALPKNSDLSQEDLVYQLRKSIKRIRALCQLLKPVLSEDDYHKIIDFIKKTGHSTTILRESSVNLKTFEQLDEMTPIDIPEKSKALIIEILNNRVQEVYLNKERAFDKIHIGVSFQLKLLQEKLNMLSFRSYPEELLYLAIKRTYTKSLRLFKNSRISLQSCTIHRWRQFNKYLIIQLKLGPLFAKGIYEEFISELKNLTDILGKEHDLAMLKAFLSTNLKNRIELQDLKAVQLHIDDERRKLQKEAFQKGCLIFSRSLSWVPQAENILV